MSRSSRGTNPVLITGAAGFICFHECPTYQYVPAPQTAFGGVRKLPQAHVLIVRHGKDPVIIGRYCRLPPPSSTRARPDPHDDYTSVQ